MKKYTNRKPVMKSITFSNGEVQFLARGQSISTDKIEVKVDGGIVVTDVKVPKKTPSQRRTSGDVKTKPNEAARRRWMEERALRHKARMENQIEEAPATETEKPKEEPVKAPAKKKASKEKKEEKAVDKGAKE